MLLRCARNAVMVQGHLKELYGPDSYYTTHYSKEELKYCGQVPYWLCQYIEDYLAHNEQQPRILDIGPGYGLLACLASQYGAQVITMDRVPFITVDVAKEYSLGSIQDDIERSNLKSTFDAIIMTEVLEHFNFNPRPTMKKIAGMLNHNGRIFLSTPDSDSWGRLDTYKSVDDIPNFPPNGTLKWPEWRDQHIWQYNEAEIRLLFKRSGLEVLEMTHSNSPGGNHFNFKLGLA